MRRTWHRSVGSAEGRYGMAVVLIMLTYVVSAANLTPPLEQVVVLIQIATVWIVFQVASSRARRAAGLVLVAAFVITVAALLQPSPDDTVTTLDKVVYGVNLALYLIAPVVIIQNIFSRRRVDAQTLLGAIAAYLLLGMMFAYTYRALGVLQTSDFFGAQGDGTMSDILFFSFITLTTTGYGNLVPAGNPGETIAVLEAILGQLFLVTALAKIVNDWTPPARMRALARGLDEADEAPTQLPRLDSNQEPAG